jgi:hypothetical protein
MEPGAAARATDRTGQAPAAPTDRSSLLILGPARCYVLDCSSPDALSLVLACPSLSQMTLAPECQMARAADSPPAPVIRQLGHQQAGSARTTWMSYVPSALILWVSQTTVSEWLLAGQVIATGVYPAGLVCQCSESEIRLRPLRDHPLARSCACKRMSTRLKKATRRFDAIAGNIKLFAWAGIRRALN